MTAYLSVENNIDVLYMSISCSVNIVLFSLKIYIFLLF